MSFSKLQRLALLALAASAQPIAENKPRPTVTVDSGSLAGTTTSLPCSNVTVNKFVGVPFGSKPVRFAPPEPVEPWNGTWDASKYGDTCLQAFAYPEAAREAQIKWFATPSAPGSESEDCLNLNVWAPASSCTKPKAVMFWIYGGGFEFGSGALPLYDGTAFAANHDVVVVTSNYRNNVFGFPGAEEMPLAEKNLGYLDQRLALDWVQRNIRAFGGDPQRVTIFGQSAGGGSVDCLVTSPPDPIPFAAAIMQAGQGTVGLANTDSAESWAKMVTALNCSNSTDGELACMRRKPAADLVSVAEHAALKFNPVHDGGATWAESARKDRLRSTRSNTNSSIARVPILSGANTGEGSSFVVGKDDLKSYLADTMPKPVAEAVYNHHPVINDTRLTENQKIATIFGEFAFECPAAVVANETRQIQVPSYRYIYNGTFPNLQIFPGAGASHASEIGLIFGTYPRKNATQLEVQTSMAMQKAWADFAKNPVAGPGWDSERETAVFGSAGGDAVVNIGDVGKIDAPCQLYSALYNLANPPKKRGDAGSS